MFTGIVEELGTIKAVKKMTKSIELEIEAVKILSDTKIGDSIAVNGVCLTVTSIVREHSFTVDVMPETFISTSIADVRKGEKVNLERAMSANGRFGGHFVSGHVDCVGKIVREKRVENARYLTIMIPTSYEKYCIHKGSITVDGTSLTLFEVGNGHVVVSLIPHTESETILGEKKVNDIVNIECDLVGKYIERFVSGSNKSNINADFLAKHGF